MGGPSPRPEATLTRQASTASRTPSVATDVSISSLSRKQMGYWMNLMNIAVASTPSQTPSPHYWTYEENRRPSSRRKTASEVDSVRPDFVNTTPSRSVSFNKSAEGKNDQNDRRKSRSVKGAKEERTLRLQGIGKVLSSGRPSIGTELKSVPEAGPGSYDPGFVMNENWAGDAPEWDEDAYKRTVPGYVPNGRRALLQWNEYKNPDMSINIPHDVYMSPTEPLSSVTASSTYTQPEKPLPEAPISPSGRRRYVAPASSGPRPVHPLEREASPSTASPVTPDLEYSPIYSEGSNDGGSERRSRGTSDTSSFEVLTPDDDASKSPVHIKKDSTDAALPMPPPIRPKDPRRSVALNRETSVYITLDTSSHDYPVQSYEYARPAAPQIPMRSNKRFSFTSTVAPDAQSVYSFDYRGAPTLSEFEAELTSQYPASGRTSVLTAGYDYRNPEQISASAAENVIYGILESIESFTDLFSAARVNKGFFNVFKRYELKLMKNAMMFMSPAAWELRESSPKEIIAAFETSHSEYTPTRYLQFHTRDTYVLAALKSLIIARCQSFLRPDTVIALEGADAERSQMIDDALWRIWTFCTIFGSNTDREFDLEAQTDWLRGGLECRFHHWNDPASANPLDSPAHFGRGNHGGLTAEELHDLNEMWNCLRSLLNDVLGKDRLEHARGAGIFAGLNIRVGEEELEAAALEEWVSYILTLGPSAVLDLATPAGDSGPGIFHVAADMHWNNWQRPTGGRSRSGFLKVAIQRVYDDLLPNPQVRPNATALTGEAQREHRRSRGTNLARELKRMKEQGLLADAPISAERPMSTWADWITTEDVPSNPYAEEVDSRPLTATSQETQILAVEGSSTPQTANGGNTPGLTTQLSSRCPSSSVLNAHVDGEQDAQEAGTSLKRSGSTSSLASSFYSTSSKTANTTNAPPLPTRQRGLIETARAAAAAAVKHKTASSFHRAESPVSSAYSSRPPSRGFAIAA